MDVAAGAPALPVDLGTAPNQGNHCELDKHFKKCQYSHFFPKRSASVGAKRDISRVSCPLLLINET